MGNWLALSTSQPLGSLALRAKSGNVYTKRLSAGPTQSEEIVGTCRELFGEAQVDPKTLERIFLDFGPGRFTGVRVGTNVAKTLSYLSGGEILVINSLQSLSFQFFGRVVVVVINAYSGFFYASKFNQQGMPLWGPCLLRQGELFEKIEINDTLVGDGVSMLDPAGLHQFGDSSILTPVFPRAEDFFIHASKFSPTTWSKLEPLYIRPSAAEEKFGAPKPSDPNQNF